MLYGFCLYGGSAYPLRGPIIATFLGLHLTAEQELFNKNMSSVRQSVEWGFGKVLHLFQFLCYKNNLNIFLQLVAMYYMVATLHVNTHTCLYGSQISSFVGLNRPNLETYLQKVGGYSRTPLQRSPMELGESDLNSGVTLVLR